MSLPYSTVAHLTAHHTFAGNQIFNMEIKTGYWISERYTVVNVINVPSKVCTVYNCIKILLGYIYHFHFVSYQSYSSYW